MHPTFNDRPARDRFLRENIEAVYHTADRRVDPVRAGRRPGSRRRRSLSGAGADPRAAGRREPGGR